MCAQYRVTLTEDEVKRLKQAGSKGIRNAKHVLYARALLLLDKGPFNKEPWTIEQRAAAVGLSPRTFNHLKEKFVTQGLDAIIAPAPYGKSKRPIKFDGEFEARLTTIACGDPPQGHSRWTVRLLAEKLVELKIVDSVSTMTVQRALKKTNLSLT